MSVIRQRAGNLGTADRGSRDRRIVRNRWKGLSQSGVDFRFSSQNVSDMVFERPQPSCYANQLFADVVFADRKASQSRVWWPKRRVSQTAIDASHRGPPGFTFLSDASVSRRPARCRCKGQVHVVTTRAIELFADTVTTRDWLVATSPRTPQGASTWMKSVPVV